MIKELYHRLGALEHLLEESYTKDVVFYNIDETSEFIKMKKSSIYQLVFQRKIPFYKRGKILLFKRSELVKWIESKKVDTYEDLAKKTNLRI